MSAETEDKLKDVAIWFYENKSRIPRGNLERKIEFLEKTISCLLEVVALQAKDIQIMEQRHPRNRLWLPESVSIDGEQPIRLRG